MTLLPGESPRPGLGKVGVQLGVFTVKPQARLADGTFPAGDPIFKTPNWVICLATDACPYGGSGVASD